MSDSIRDAVIAVATVTDILRLYGCEVSENLKRAILCPLHAERSPSFNRDSSDKLYHCKGCGAGGGVLDLVVALKLALSTTRAVDFLAEYYHISKGALSSARPVSFRREIKPITQLQVKPSVPAPKLTAENDMELRAALRGGKPLLGSPGEQYLRGRGIKPPFAAEMRVGFHPNWLGCGEAVVFLGFDIAGNLVCAQGRYLSPTADPKTKSKCKVSLGCFATPGAFAKGLNGHFGPVGIVEGPIDAILLAQTGLPTIATFGSSNRQEWLRKVLARRDVILALDDDKAGREASQWYRNNLNLGTDTSVTLLFGGFKDAGELWERSPVKLAQLVEEAIRATDPLRLAVSTAVEAVTGRGQPVSEALPIASAAETLSDPAPAGELVVTEVVANKSDAALALEYAGNHREIELYSGYGWKDGLPIETGYVEGAWLWYGRQMGCYREAWPDVWPGLGRCSVCQIWIEECSESEALALFRRHVEAGHAPLPLEPLPTESVPVDNRLHLEAEAPSTVAQPFEEPDEISYGMGFVDWDSLIPGVLVIAP